MQPLLKFYPGKIYSSIRITVQILIPFTIKSIFQCFTDKIKKIENIPINSFPKTNTD